jgi:hypothetical protein
MSCRNHHLQNQSQEHIISQNAGPKSISRAKCISEAPPIVAFVHTVIHSPTFWSLCKSWHVLLLQNRCLVRRWSLSFASSMSIYLAHFLPCYYPSIRHTIEIICETWPNLQKRLQRGKHQKSKAKTSCKIVMDILSNQLWVIHCALIYWKTIRSTINVTSNLTHQQKHVF